MFAGISCETDTSNYYTSITMTYEHRTGDLNFDSRARTPVKGLRARLRTALRAAGIVEKFRTDLHRNGTLYIISKHTIQLPFDTFEEYPLKLKIVHDAEI